MASGKISAAVLGLALVMRLTNAPLVFAGAVPRLSPLDELYHWKRITFSATHFPAALEFDRDRGERGLFCPWPPLYDVACAAVSRLFGGRTAAEVLWRVIWVPPLIGAAAAALAAWLIAKQFGARAAIAGGIALATSPFIVTQSSIGDIDHHYLEWPLAFAIIAGTCLILRGGSWVPMTIAMTLAMFVQSALLVACGIAFVILFFLTDGRAAAIAF